MVGQDRLGLGQERCRGEEGAGHRTEVGSMGVGEVRDRRGRGGGGGVPGASPDIFRIDCEDF